MGEGALSEAFDVAEHLVDLGEVMSPSIALSGFLGVGPRLLRGDTEQHGTRQDVGRADRVEQQQALGGQSSKARFLATALKKKARREK